MSSSQISESLLTSGLLAAPSSRSSDSLPPFAVPAPFPPASPSVPAIDEEAAHGAHRLILPLATTTLAAHLLLVSWFGTGVPQSPARPVRPPAEVVTPATIENVVLEPEPPVPQAVESKPDDVLLPESPSAAVPLDLPALAQIQPIAAVSAATPVAFGLAVKGPVRVVKDAAFASASAGGARRAQPVSLDGGNARDLLLPTLNYPPRARRLNLQGEVALVFETTAAGDIQNIRVLKTSGHAVLDQAAESNLRAGRWKGRPGLFTKTFEFRLQ